MMKKYVRFLLVAAMLAPFFIAQAPEEDKVASAVPPEPMIWYGA